MKKVEKTPCQIETSKTTDSHFCIGPSARHNHTNHAFVFHVRLLHFKHVIFSLETDFVVVLQTYRRAHRLMNAIVKQNLSRNA